MTTFLPKKVSNHQWFSAGLEHDFSFSGHARKQSIWEWKKQPVFGHWNHSIGILDICNIFNEITDNNLQLHHDHTIHTIELCSCAKTIWRKYHEPKNEQNHWFSQQTEATKENNPKTSGAFKIKWMCHYRRFYSFEAMKFIVPKSTIHTQNRWNLITFSFHPKWMEHQMRKSFNSQQYGKIVSC